MDVLESVA